MADSGVSPPAGSQCDALTTDGVGSHHTGDTVVAFSYYSVGIQNNEFLGANWNRKGSVKQANLKRDIKNIFASSCGIQAVFISEWGHMFPNIDDMLIGLTDADGNISEILFRNYTKFYFDTIIAELNLSHIEVYAMPPYVALVNPSYWQVHAC